MTIASDVMADPHAHMVQFYDRDEDLAVRVSAFLAAALADDGAAAIISTAAHADAFRAALTSAGADVSTAVSTGRLIVLDAADALTRFMIDGTPDAEAFDAVIGGLIRDLAGPGRRVHAYGEMVALLWDEGNVTAALQLEELWNRLGRSLAFSLLCGYATGSVSGPDHALAVAEVCRLHTTVLGAAPTVTAHRKESVTTIAEQTRTFPRLPGSLRAARRFVAETLTQGGRAELVEDACTLVTELAANAVVHAHSDFTVSIRQRADGTVRVAVLDSSTVPPRLRQPERTSGRGMMLVAALARRWGHDIAADGKTVWAELPGPDGRGD